MPETFGVKLGRGIKWCRGSGAQTRSVSDPKCGSRWTCPACYVHIGCFKCGGQGTASPGHESAEAQTGGFEMRLGPRSSSSNTLSNQSANPRILLSAASRFFFFSAPEPKHVCQRLTCSGCHALVRFLSSAAALGDTFFCSFLTTNGWLFFLLVPFFCFLTSFG